MLVEKLKEIYLFPFQSLT